MDKITTMGTPIFTVMGPTRQLLTPKLFENESSIRSIPRVEYNYGAHPRQKLDWYSASNSSAPILIFCYGGGLIHGDKIVVADPDLVYANLGSFFAQRGYTTIVADYRRVNSPGKGEDAVFPSGGEDVALVLKWLEKHLQESGDAKRDVFLLGNSAGALHISTFLLEPRWKEERMEFIGDKSTVKLRGATLLAMPAHFDEAAENRTGMLKDYYGSVEACKRLCPYGLLKSAIETKKSQKETGVPPVLSIVAEFDPADEIVRPNDDFAELWKKGWGAGFEYRVIPKHNHISPPYTLLTGDEEAEKWGVDLVEWMDEQQAK